MPYYSPACGGKDVCTTTPFIFTSPHNVVAKWFEVRNDTTPAPGPEGAVRFTPFHVLNVAGTYQAPATNATHIHLATCGASGHPRLAFPNPVSDDHRICAGCTKTIFRLSRLRRTRLYG